MVVKVISDKPIKTDKLICKNCGYELEYTNEDVETCKVTNIGEPGLNDYIKCPRPSCLYDNCIRQH